jgi:hypothetical protein
MNNTFDLRRFGFYARKEFSENWKAYALGLVGMLAILMYFVYDEWEFVHNASSQKVGYLLNIFRSLAIMMGPITWVAGSYILKIFSNRKQTFTTLTLPVSAFEQFLYAWLVAVPLSILVCYVLWKIAWAIALPYFLADFPDLIIEEDSIYWISNPYFSVFFVGGASVFMWGAVSLGRLNFLKTLGILIVAGLIFEWGQDRFLEIIFPNAFSIQSPTTIPWMPQKITIESSKGIFSNDIHSSFENIYGFWWVLCVPLLLYTITFLKIKEKEI